MNKIKKIWVFCIALLSPLLLGSCDDDIDPEITELKVSRLFSPTDIEVLVIDKTGARVKWKAVKDADSYDLDFGIRVTDEDYVVIPGRSFTNLKMTDQPFLVSGFDGDTDYAVRIKAKGEGIAESKWMSKSFTTGTEQIFKAVNPEDLAATSVVLTWPAGEIATTIRLTPAAGDVMVYEVSAADIEAGRAEVSGLLSETDYTAVLLNGEKIRGTMSFKTLIDLGGAIAVYPEDNLKDAITNAEDGTTLALFPGTYIIGGGAIDITKNISIVAARPTEKPVVHAKFILSGTANSNFSLDNIILSGFTVDVETGLLTEVRDTYVLDLTSSAVFNTVSLNNVTVQDFQRSLLRATSGGGEMQNFKVDNTLVLRTCDGNNEFIDLRSGIVRNISITRSTFANSPLTRRFLRADAIAGFEGQQILIDKCTFYNSSTPAAQFMQIRTVGSSLTFTKNLLAIIGTGTIGDTDIVASKSISGNNYFQADVMLGFESGGLTNDPGFVNADAYNFTVSDEDVFLYGIGDPRWLP